MKTFMILFGIMLVLISLYASWRWGHTDWEEQEKDSDRFLDEEGNHAYYDRHRRGEEQEKEKEKQLLRP